MELKTNQIRTDGGTQARAQLDNEAVQEYRDILKENGTTWPFPPVVVFHDGSEYWLADGFHRIAAARQHGRFVIEADVRQGQQRDAILFAAGANADHGLRRTAEDKRRAVMRLLEDEEWGQWADREIARRCKVSPTFVGGLRVTVHVDSEELAQRTYTNKHGNQAVMNTSAIGSGNRIEIDKGRACDWLRDYEDANGRTWEDLEDNQVHHANSPCYQAYVRAFPNQVDPKFYLKYALYRLRREGEAGETAVLNELTQNDLLEKAAAWLTSNPDGGLSAFVHFLDLEGTPYTLQYARDAFAEAKAQDKAVTAVANEVPATAVAAPEESGELVFLFNSDGSCYCPNRTNQSDWKRAADPIDGWKKASIAYSFIIDIVNTASGTDRDRGWQDVAQDRPGKVWGLIKYRRSSWMVDTLLSKVALIVLNKKGDTPINWKSQWSEEETAVSPAIEAAEMFPEKDEVLDLLKRAESALCLAVAKYNGKRPSFALANRAYRELLEAMQNYKKEDF